jgi:hypothetical protein
MLKFSVQTFYQHLFFSVILFFIIHLFTCAYIVWVISPYQPLFSHTFPFSNFPLAIFSLPVIIFPSSNYFPFQKFPTPKSPKQKNQAKAQTKAPQNAPKQKVSRSPSVGLFIPSGKQGGAKTL